MFTAEVNMLQYTTVAGKQSAELEEKRSRFIANLSFADTEEKALDFITQIKKQHTMANHNVYAYILRCDNRMRASDDGEPAKTAGLPVLDVFRHANITDCVCVVTRYFGGTLLGTGGLVRAYGGAAKLVLEKATLSVVNSCICISFCVQYALYEQALRILQDCGAKVEPPVFEADVKITATMLDGTQQNAIEPLNALTRGKTIFDVSKPFFAPF